GDSLEGGRVFDRFVGDYLQATGGSAGEGPIEIVRLFARVTKGSRASAEAAAEIAENEFEFGTMSGLDHAQARVFEARIAPAQPGGEDAGAAELAKIGAAEVCKIPWTDAVPVIFLDLNICVGR